MFRAFIGGAGTGKSTAMMDEIKKKIEERPIGDPIVVVTPTQGTYLYEQAFVSNPSLKGSLRAEVLHFERLSHRVFQEVGGVSETRLSSTSIEMMIYQILQDVRKQLKLYQSQVKYLGFSTKVREQIQDFEKYAITPEIVANSSKNSQLANRTQDKLHDMSLVYDTLQARMGSDYLTGEGLMQRFISMIPKSDWLRRADIYIDGFHNFSTQEYQLIEALVGHAKSVTVLLTTNGDTDPLSMYRKPSESLSHLREIAVQSEKSLEIIRFNEVQRFKYPSLKALATEFDALQPQGIQSDDGAVTIFEATSVREEVNEIARQILADVRDNQYRYRDIAILYRDPNYVYLLESILSQYDIPYNVDVKKSMVHHPIMEMFVSMIEALKTNWQFEPMMRLFKTNVLTQNIPNSRYLIDILENYAMERGIFGNRWFDDKYFQLDSFKTMGIKRHRSRTEDEEETFQRVILMKESVVQKLLRLEQKLSEGGHAVDYATALYEVLEAFELPSHLMTYRDELEVHGRHEQAEEVDQIWKGFIRILDEIVAVFDQQEMSHTRFLELLNVGLNGLEFSMIPQTMDQVTIGTMDLAKVDNKCHVYLIGMNDGVLPQAINGKSLMSDDEKKAFELQTGMQLSPTADILQMDEAFVGYFAMTRACERLTMTYSLMDSSGAEKEASPYLNDVKIILPAVEIQNISQLNIQEAMRCIVHPHQTKVHLFESLRAWMDGQAIPDTWFTAYDIMSKEPELRRGMTHLTTALDYQNDTVKLDQELTYALYGKTINASVSRFEGYNSCPFKHYASHGLRLNERTKYELQNFDLGTIFHDVLRYIAEKVEGRFQKLTLQQIQALTQEALDIYLPKVQFNLLNATSYYRYLSQRIGAIVQATLQALRYQSENSQFRPIAFEKAFRKKPHSDDELIASSLTTKQGVPINIRGQIDRIDVFNKNGKSFINIIDYKSSEKSSELDLVKVYYGLQMQMMTYMDIALQNKVRLGLTDDVKPGGFLYMHVHKFKDKKRSWDKVNPDDYEAQFLKSYKLDGLLNNDPDVVDAFDRRLESGFGSDIVPVGMTKAGKFNAYSKVVNEDIIRLLMQRNKENFVETASQIMDGHTEVAPLKYDNTLPCRFCQYKSVCHVDSLIDSAKYRRVDEKIKPLELLATSDEEEETR
ncbi:MULTISPECIES: helicase-exonuclease AddAB subunit AddB [unclassified Staphylococcus]|uniref:helicase-exonuclease AddAB subunit AddB n=1 Tax=unclassified Staphylococcus TaxID=91994 RepID=UPI0021D2A40C|nr:MULTISPECIES: helicase-exonuclease AddAB subunit AddB [unclassified Staphylococcus]UXR72154.1 helicase-exonuclease AddAB subunit AddB [Staphylococcus sp. IVB6240]UXR74462.1 helicase-exonuclease AddAB subunit AddB [Staphylococcus sp. IVB6238]UXR76846.1 helicase-exonuclease AddAB subunit AddB [Staphylococcus sp. IVB6233]UXR80973.1 helicase-exonuclease AddAB subunit AddB [Staphylococcus sp. IVB6218]